MKSRIHAILNRFLKLFSLRLIKTPRHPKILETIKKQILLQPECQCIYVGCGDDKVEGFIGSDLRPTDTAAIICPAWELSKHTSDVECIYSRHMLEHLTFEQTIITLSDWYDVLRPSGTVLICVPNLAFHIEKFNQLCQADVDQWDFVLAKNCKVSEALTGFYGWQRDSSPNRHPNDIKNWDIHKSGYNIGLMESLLRTTGFQNIRVTTEEERHLVATARKPNQ